MPDYIDREAAIDALDMLSDKMTAGGRTALQQGIDLLKDMYAADVRPVVRGEWNVISSFDDCVYARCMNCKIVQVFYYNKPLTSFCPNCGAYMMGKESRKQDG